MVWTSAQFGFVRLSRPLLDRVVDHAAEAEPGRGGALPGEGGADHRGAGGAADGDEGAAARLFQGHAGGQGAGLRRRRRADAGAGRDGGDGGRHGAAGGAAQGGGGGGVLDRDRPRRLAGAAAGAAVPRGAPRHRGAGAGGRRRRAWTWPGSASRRCGRCIRGFYRRFTSSWVWTTLWRVVQAMVARRRLRCSRRYGVGRRRSGERRSGAGWASVWRWRRWRPAGSRAIPRRPSRESRPRRPERARATRETQAREGSSMLHASPRSLIAFAFAATLGRRRPGAGRGAGAPDRHRGDHRDQPRAGRSGRRTSSSSSTR